MSSTLSRRSVLCSAAAALVAGCSHRHPGGDDGGIAITDIHQHTHYSGRTDDQLLNHQEVMGVSRTVLLPAGRYVKRAITHNGLSNGLAAAILTWESAKRLVDLFPGRYWFFANEVPDEPDVVESIERQLAAGAVGIGEQKFNIDCDAPEMRRIYEIAEHHGVPVLLHFQHETYNKHYERFYTMLEKYPKVNFIGHAQTFWANIDKSHADQAVLYPKGAVTMGGWTDRYLSDYANMFADMSAGSGLNALMRDEDHARAFLVRHQDKLIYGSDCNDRVGRWVKAPATSEGATRPSAIPQTCQGAQTIATIRRLVNDGGIERKIFAGNAMGVIGIPS